VAEVRRDLVLYKSSSCLCRILVYSYANRYELSEAESGLTHEDGAQTDLQLLNSTLLALCHRGMEWKDSMQTNESSFLGSQ
jgi:hypothetical protein